MINTRQMQQLLQRLWWQTRVTAIQCNGTTLPHFINAHTTTSHAGMFPFAHGVVYACDFVGHRFDDGEVTTTVTCSETCWTWDHVVTSCGRMLCYFLALCYFLSILYVYLSWDLPAVEMKWSEVIILTLYIIVVKLVYTMLVHEYSKQAMVNEYEY